ncbi:hypothetical protein NIES25_15650 [Nostoc linckia NIES-25]|nr:hypothetical protein NIES25_15650 [Nostoc linckia NIES-25]
MAIQFALSPLYWLSRDMAEEKRGTNHYSFMDNVNRDTSAQGAKSLCLKHHYLFMGIVILNFEF